MIVRYFFLSVFISVNLWAMKRSEYEPEPESEPEPEPKPSYEFLKKKVLEKQDDEDHITFQPIDYADSILIEKGKNNYVAYSAAFLYKWFFGEEKDTIPGIETRATDNLTKLIKLYHKAIPLAKGMSTKEIDEITMWLFRLYLDENSENIHLILGDLINQDIYSLMIRFIDDRGKLTEAGLIFLKRFLRSHHLNEKQFPLLQYNEKEVNEKLKNKNVVNHWSLRKSSTYPDEYENFSYCLVFFTFRENTSRENTSNKSINLVNYRIFYKSGVGFFLPHSKEDKYQYCTNLIDILDVLFMENKTTKCNYINNI